MDTNRITTAESDVGTLIKGAFQDLEKLATQHVKLFQKELNEDAKKAGEGLIALIIGLNIFFVGAVLLGFAAAHGLMHLMPPWSAYLIVGVLVCIVGGIALVRAQNRLKAAATNVAPKCAEELEEDAKWLKNPK
jgi:hypothetical protein